MNKHMFDSALYVPAPGRTRNGSSESELPPAGSPAGLAVPIRRESIAAYREEEQQAASILPSLCIYALKIELRGGPHPQEAERSDDSNRASIRNFGYSPYVTRY